jgi:integrase
VSAQPKPYRRPGKSGYYCRLMVPKPEGKGYRAAVRSLGTSDLREARKRFPAAYARLQEEEGITEHSPSYIRERIPEALQSIKAGVSEVEDEVARISGQKLTRDIDSGEFFLTPEQEAISNALIGKNPKLIPPTWEELIDAWGKRRERKKGSKPGISATNTIKLVIRELSQVRKNINPLTLDEHQTWAWISWQEGKGIKPTTIQSKVAMLQALTKAASVVKLIPDDPLAKLEYGSVSGQSYRSPTPEEYRLIWGNINCLSELDNLLLQTLMLTGMRLDEPASRFGRHLDRENTLSIESLEEPTPWKPKNSGSIRKIPLPEGLLLPRTGNDEQIFSQCNYRSGKFGKTASQRIKSKIWTAAQLPNDPLLVIHSLRAGFIDALRAVQCPLEIEEAIVGHARAQSKVHREYGNGYPLEVKREWLNKGAEFIRGYAS